MSDRTARGRAAPADEPLLDGALAVFDLVYESSDSPARLVEALTRMAELVRAPSLLVFATEGGERRLVAAARSSPHALPPASAAGGTRLRTIPLAGGYELVLDPSSVDPPREVLLLRLAPHLARALRLADRHEHEQQEESGLAARLDRAPIALLLLDGGGRVVLVNRAARTLLAGACAVSLDAQRIAIEHGVSRLLFESLLEALGAPPDSGRRRGGRLSIPDAHWGRIDLLAAPFAARLATGEASTAVLLSAAGVSPTPEERLARSCGLSTEEAHVATDLLAGRSHPDDTAREAVERTIGAIYAKLGTTRRSDLLRFVLRPAGVVFDSSPGSPRPG